MFQKKLQRYIKYCVYKPLYTYATTAIYTPKQGYIYLYRML